MGPTDPFSTSPPARATPTPRADGLLPAPDPGRPPRRVPAVAIGAALGLVFGVSTVTWGIGPALVVLLFTALGAAVGVLARAVLGGGIDLTGAWRALLRR